MVRQLGWVLVLAGAVACNVESTANEGSGGIGDDDTQDDDAKHNDDTQDDDVSSAADAGPEGDAGKAEPPLECPQGVTVVMSDFFSTQVALGTVEGETLSASFISTGSSETAGLAFALSGDVVVPTQAPESGRVVLLDRFGTNVITWLDPRNAKVLGQLPVGTGFESNPQDYVEIGGGLAFVSRMGQNAEPGKEDFDRGGDVLVIDTEEPSIEASIELPVEGGFPPGPSSMVRLGDRVLVNLERYLPDFSAAGEAMWASLSAKTQEIEWVEPLPGYKDCGAPVLSPDGTRLAMACTGFIQYTGAIEDLSQSAILLFDPKEDPPALVETYPAEEIAGEPLQDTLAFASNDLLLFKTQSQYFGPTNNRLLALSLSSGDLTELLEARPNSDGTGKGVVFGAIRCAPGCTNVCVMSDSDRGVLQRFRVVDGEVRDIADVRVDESVGLSPIDLTYR